MRTLPGSVQVAALQLAFDKVPINDALSNAKQSQHDTTIVRKLSLALRNSWTSIRSRKQTSAAIIPSKLRVPGSPHPLRVNVTRRTITVSATQAKLISSLPSGVRDSNNNCHQYHNDALNAETETQLGILSPDESLFRDNQLKENRRVTFNPNAATIIPYMYLEFEADHTSLPLKSVKKLKGALELNRGFISTAADSDESLRNVFCMLDSYLSPSERMAEVSC